ncbi:hypothetical protein ACSVDE_17085 [Pseudalkalibacillus sp. Hm43]|uniref:hypothetical protein n=1 Tax=Pseudalkalibacillus sp. Hm43 TaxID=3450742 RepID=UPI003F43D733
MLPVTQHVFGLKHKKMIVRAVPLMVTVTLVPGVSLLNVSQAQPVHFLQLLVLEGRRELVELF